MRKIFAIFTALLLLSCSTNHDEVIVNISSQNTLTKQHEQIRNVVMDVLNKIDPPTRGSARTIKNIESITYGELFGDKTRNEIDSINKFITDTALYVVNFTNNSGYALLKPNVEQYNPDDWGTNQQNTTPISLLAITESGSLTADQITAYGNDIDNSDFSISDFYVEADDDYLIGGANADEFVSRLAVNYTYNKNNYEENLGDIAAYVEIDKIAHEKVDPLLKTKWRQRAPFNYYFPLKDNGVTKHPAGCIPIAVAQIVTFFRNVDLSYHFGVTQHTWIDIEEEIYERNDTTTYNDIRYSTAKIIKRMADHIGVKYNYGTKNHKGTFATPRMAQKYLEDYLGYDVERKVEGRGSKRLKEIVSSLNDNKPVLMAAIGKGSGHAWVVDGYMQNQYSSDSDKTTDYYIHCNFGWGGVSDGWYLIGMLSNDKNDDSLLDFENLEREINYTCFFRYLFFN